MTNLVGQFVGWTVLLYSTASARHNLAQDFKLNFGNLSKELLLKLSSHMGHRCLLSAD